MSFIRTYCIGEIGINHQGDLKIAKKLIDLAAIAGCDAVKFQKRNPSVCVPEHQKNEPKHTPWGDMTYLKYKEKMEFGFAEYQEIDKYCQDNNITWSASPWDLDSLEFLTQFQVPWIKIPSAMLTNIELLRESINYCCKDKNKYKRLIISTGMSTEKEIDISVEFIKSYSQYKTHNQAWWHENLIVMHCHSAYPAPIDELNLSCIQTIKNRYKCQAGYSGHEFTLGTTVAAIYLGATYIERHITLDRSMWGSDHMASVGPKGLIGLVSGIRELERAYGDGGIRVYDSELASRKKLRGY